MNGHSTTLEEIGFVDYLSESDHEWESLPDEIWSIGDDEKRQVARGEFETADYFAGGINAIAQTGELVAADHSDSRIGAYPFAAANVVVSGVNKIVPTLDDALDRLESVVYPLENKRAKEAYGVDSAIAKQLISGRNSTRGGRRSCPFANGWATDAPALTTPRHVIPDADPKNALHQFKNEVVSQLECAGPTERWRLTSSEIEFALGVNGPEVLAASAEH
jgi:hypothetical protein